MFVLSFPCLADIRPDHVTEKRCTASKKEEQGAASCAIKIEEPRPDPKKKASSSTSTGMREDWTGSWEKWVFKLPSHQVWSRARHVSHIDSLGPCLHLKETGSFIRLDDFQLPLSATSTQGFSRMPWSPQTVIHRAGTAPEYVPRQRTSQSMSLL